MNNRKCLCLIVLLAFMVPTSLAREGGTLILRGDQWSGPSDLANIYPGREIFNPISAAYPDGSPYHEWRMYYSGWDVDCIDEAVFAAEVNEWGTARDRIYIACSPDDANYGAYPFKYGVVLGPPTGSDPWDYPDGLHVGDPAPVIGPDWSEPSHPNVMYLFYSTAYCPDPNVQPGDFDIVNTICAARANSPWPSDAEGEPNGFTKSPDNPIIEPMFNELSGNTFMPTVKYHDGKFKMWFLGAEILDGYQSYTPISIWYTECDRDPMYNSNWSIPVKVFRDYCTPTSWNAWDRLPFYMDVRILSDSCYEIFYTAHHPDMTWDGTPIPNVQVGINHFWSKNGYEHLMDPWNNDLNYDDDYPILDGRWHDEGFTYPDGWFMGLAYVSDYGGLMYYGAYDDPVNSTKCEIYRYTIGYPVPDPNLPW